VQTGSKDGQVLEGQKANEPLYKSLASFGQKKLKKIAVIVFFSLFYFLHKALPQYPSEASGCTSVKFKVNISHPPCIYLKNAQIRQI
jgi:hypothetical protein